jgi:hypothetical protein
MIKIDKSSSLINNYKNIGLKVDKHYSLFNDEKSFIKLALVFQFFILVGATAFKLVGFNNSLTLAPRHLAQ